MVVIREPDESEENSEANEPPEPPEPEISVDEKTEVEADAIDAATEAVQEESEDESDEVEADQVEVDALDESASAETEDQGYVGEVEEPMEANTTSAFGAVALLVVAYIFTRATAREQQQQQPVPGV